MKNALSRLLLQIVPYLWFGLFILIGLAGLILLSYLLIWGAILGVLLYAIFYVKQRFFTKNRPPVRKMGRIYDQDDFTH